VLWCNRLFRKAISLSSISLLMLGGALELFTRKARILFEEAWLQIFILQMSNKVLTKWFL